MHDLTLPAGTLCKRNGIPFSLPQDTQIECHPDNWPLIRDEFVPEVSYGPTFVLSHALQSAEKPLDAHADDSSPTASKSSLASSADKHKSRT